jgi:hypothetical protein
MGKGLFHLVLEMPCLIALDVGRDKVLLGDKKPAVAVYRLGNGRHARRTLIYTLHGQKPLKPSKLQSPAPL